MSNDVNVEVLVSAVNADEKALAESIHLETTAVIVNQCNVCETTAFSHNGRNIKCISMKDRGVGLSRNTALMNASEEICLFCDEDITLYHGYEQMILDGFREKAPCLEMLPIDRLQQMSEQELIEYHKAVRAEVPEGYACDFVPWQELLGIKVSLGNLQRVGLQECIHAVLTEMTFHGMTEEAQDERRQELDEAIEEIEEIRTLPQEAGYLEGEQYDISNF